MDKNNNNNSNKFYNDNKTKKKNNKREIEIFHHNRKCIPIPVVIEKFTDSEFNNFYNYLYDIRYNSDSVKRDVMFKADEKLSKKFNINLDEARTIFIMWAINLMECNDKTHW